MCVSLTGGKGTTIDWATALMTTSDDPDRSRVYKGRRSSPSPQGRCTASAAQRMVRRDILYVRFVVNHLLLLSAGVFVYFRSVFVLFSIYYSIYRL